MTAAGAAVFEVDFPSIEERTKESGDWNWRHGDPDKSEMTVGNVDAYNGLNTYLSGLGRTSMKTVEDIMAYNEANTGTEGASPGDHPAFASGQDGLREIVATKGVEDAIYHKALAHIRRQTQQNGIDAALTTITASGQTVHLDALLFCDRKGIGTQYAAQAGYPIITIPIGLDDDGLPIGLSLQQTAWQEGKLIRFASAIEDLLREMYGSRKPPTFRNHLAKNVPIDIIP
jgi:amidase